MSSYTGDRSDTVSTYSSSAASEFSHHSSSVTSLSMTSSSVVTGTTGVSVSVSVSGSRRSKFRRYQRKLNRNQNQNQNQNQKNSRISVKILITDHCSGENRTPRPLTRKRNPQFQSNSNNSNSSNQVGKNESVNNWGAGSSGGSYRKRESEGSSTRSRVSESESETTSTAPVSMSSSMDGGSYGGRTSPGQSIGVSLFESYPVSSPLGFGTMSMGNQTMMDDEEEFGGGTNREGDVGVEKKGGRVKFMSDRRNGMNDEFEIEISETPTFFLYDGFMESVSKVIDPELHAVTVERNKKLQVAKEKKKEFPRKYLDKNVQTLEIFKKNKYTEKESTEMVDQEISVKEYEIYDCYQEIKRKAELLEEEKSRQKKKEEEEGGEEEEGEGEDSEEDDWQEFQIMNDTESNVYRAESLPKNIEVIERILVHNQNEDCVHKFLSSNKTMEKDKKEHVEEDDGGEQITEQELDGKKTSETKKNKLDLLWKFEFSPVKNIPVNGMSFNKVNPNVLATCFGKTDLDSSLQKSRSGYLLLWNIKNIKYPERVFKVKNKAIVCLDFSKENPNLLGCGTGDGTILVYDIRNKKNCPVLDCSNAHQHTVWDCLFVNSSLKKEELFYTIGVDGRVLETSVKKGLETLVINKLRKKSSDYKGVLNRETGGLCFDFHPADPRIYVVGTENGDVMKFSTSYNEQVLRNFDGHTGAVYTVKWNPICHDKFITCSADWTVKLWNDSNKNSSPELSIEPYLNKENKTTSRIEDIDWDKFDENVFGFVSVSKELEIWDIGQTIFDAKHVQELDDIPSSILFPPFKKSVLVGDCKGVVSVYAIAK